MESIQNGNQQIKITDPKFLMACLVTEECENDKNVKKFLNVILGSKNVIDMQDRPQIRVGLVNEKGKVRWLFINLSICSAALGIIDILNDTYAKIHVEKDEKRLSDWQCRDCLNGCGSVQNCQSTGFVFQALHKP